MWRCAFKLQCGISLLLCLATAVLWVRSYRRWDTLITPWPTQAFGLRSAHGRILVNLKLTKSTTYPPPTGFHADEPQIVEFLSAARYSYIINEEPLHVDPLPKFPRRSFSCNTIDFTPAMCFTGGSIETDKYLRIRFPHWLAISILGIGPGVFLFTRVVCRRRIQSGLCAHCGYDLRATPTRCPECGTEIIPISGPRSTVQDSLAPSARIAT